MGIRDLTSYLLKRNCQIANVHLKNPLHTVVIDGNSLIYHLISEYKMESRIVKSGGSYWIFEEKATEWLQNLQKVIQIQILVDCSKESTKQNEHRNFERYKACLELSNKIESKFYIARMNLGYYIYCLEYICKKLNIAIASSCREANLEIAKIVIQKKYFACMSTDSDFYCLQAPFIPFSSLKFNNHEISASIFTATHVAKALGLKHQNLLPYFKYLTCDNKNFHSFEQIATSLNDTTFFMFPARDVFKERILDSSPVSFGLSREIYYFLKDPQLCFTCNLHCIAIPNGITNFNQFQYDAAMCKFHSIRMNILSMGLGENIIIEQHLQTSHGVLTLKSKTFKVPRLKNDLQNFCWILGETRDDTFAMHVLRAFSRIEILTKQEQIAIYLHFHPQFTNNVAMSSDSKQSQRWKDDDFADFPNARATYITTMLEMFINLCIDANVVCNRPFVLERPSHVFDAERLLDELEGNDVPECSLDL